MFRKNPPASPSAVTPIERVTSVLGTGINWKGDLHGSGGIRIEGTFDGEIAGSVRGNITAEKIEIRSTGRVWGDVTTVAFATEEGAFLRGQVRMEEKVELQFEPPADALDQNQPAENPTDTQGEQPA